MTILDTSVDCAGNIEWRDVTRGPTWDGTASVEAAVTTVLRAGQRVNLGAYKANVGLLSFDPALNTNMRIVSARLRLTMQSNVDGSAYPYVKLFEHNFKYVCPIAVGDAEPINSMGGVNPEWSGYTTTTSWAAGVDKYIDLNAAAISRLQAIADGSFFTPFQMYLVHQLGIDEIDTGTDDHEVIVYGTNGVATQEPELEITYRDRATGLLLGHNF